jgi:hypothetical protein
VSSLSNAGSFWNQVLRRGASALGDAPGSELGWRAGPGTQATHPTGAGEAPGVELEQR